MNGPLFMPFNVIANLQILGTLTAYARNKLNNYLSVDLNYSQYFGIMKE